jgi:hypothetical protein
MSDAVLVVLIVVVGLIVLASMLVMARVIMSLSEGLNDANDRTTTHLRALTSQFAEGCMAISEPNQQIILRRLEVEHPVPDRTPPRTYPTERDINDIIVNGPPMHGGDPNG